jgi:hypothetical protein
VCAATNVAPCGGNAGQGVAFAFEHTLEKTGTQMKEVRMNTIEFQQGGTPGIRRGRGVAASKRTAPIRIETSYACPSRTGAAPPRYVRAAPHIEGRRDRPREGSIMKRIEERIERFVAGAGRFVFGLGIGVALTSVYVIVSSAPDLLSGRPTPADIVRLDPVVVTISAERFAEIHAEADVPAKPAHVYGAGPRQV